MRGAMRNKFSRFVQAIVSALLAAALTPRTACAGELAAIDDAPAYKQVALRDTDGQLRDLSEFRGELLIVHFWASWCTPCIEEMPAIQRLQKALNGYPSVLVSINVGEAERRVQTASRRLGITFPVLLDHDSQVFDAWGGEVLPTTYILDADGRMRYVAQGPLDWERPDVLNILKDLMPRPAGALGLYPSQH